MNELTLSLIYCTLMAGGASEQTHAYPVGYDLHRIRVDCETRTEVIEVGLDKRSSLDSLQQALFAADLTGKTPVVLIIDRDGRVGPFETRIRAASRMAGVEYRSVHRDYLIRIQMTDRFRDARGVAQPGS